MADLNNLMLLSLMIWREECGLVPVNVHMQSKIRGKGDEGKIGVKRVIKKNKPVEGLHQRINGGYLCFGSQTRAEDGQRAAAARRWRAGTDGGGCTVRECRPGSRRGGSGKPGRGYGWRAANKRRQRGGGGREQMAGLHGMRVPAGKQAGREREAGARIRVAGGQQAAAARRWRAGMCAVGATWCGPGSKWGGCGKPAAVPGSAAAAGSQRGAASERWEQEGGSEEMRRLRWGASEAGAGQEAGGAGTEQTGALRHFDDDKPRNYVLAERFPCLVFRRYEEVWTRRISAREEHSHATRLTRINAPDDAAAGAAARSRKR
ncbi:hypothetical protein B0H14DRAFT_2600246 [Mycena olivaceomarginata]|nr:hypothetical protein B0H14DRAFT_2600246 [Mycena olivaceomarginata]